MSVPYDRDINTISLNPKLASHAPKVRRSTLVEVFAALTKDIINGTNNTRVRVIPSNDKRDIKKWDWLISRLNMATIGKSSIIVIIETYIELRGVSIFGLQDQCLISFQFIR